MSPEQADRVETGDQARRPSFSGDPTDRAIPALASRDLERTRKFYRYFGFEPIGDPQADERWLWLKRNEVELSFYLTSVDFSDPDFAICQPICVIRVADVHAWHDVFAKTRMGWKWLNPSLTSPRNDLWGGRWAFCLTDRDANLIWCVASDDPSP